MPQIPLTISNGSGPYTVSIKQQGTNTNVTCTSGCDQGSSTSRTLVFNAITGLQTYVVSVTDGNQCTTSGTYTFSPIDCTCINLADSATCSGTPNVAKISGTIMSHNGSATYTIRIKDNGGNVVPNTTLSVPSGGLTFDISVPHNQSYTLELLKNGTVVQTSCASIAAPNCPCTLSVALGTPAC